MTTGRSCTSYIMTLTGKRLSLKEMEAKKILQKEKKRQRRNGVTSFSIPLKSKQHSP